MTTPSGASPEDDYWRRPTPDEPGPGATGESAAGPSAGATAPGTGPAAPSHGPTAPGSGYAGPPQAAPPPPGWRPPVHLQPAAPRHLPPQDMAGMDAAEQRAQRLTYGLGAVAGAVLVILLCLLCSRAIF